MHRVGMYAGLVTGLTLLAAMGHAQPPSTSDGGTDVAQPSSVFTRPGLVVLVSIRDKWQSELTNIDGESFKPPRVRRLALARVEALVRVNERPAPASEIAHGHLVLNLESDLDVAFGRPYILMVNAAPDGPLWPWGANSPPSYAMAAENPGFEVDDNNVVHALRRTRESAPFEGKLFAELVKAIERER